MEWPSWRMNTPITLSKGLLIAFALVAGSWAGKSWMTPQGIAGTPSDTGKVAKIGFESLFMGASYDPSMPYESQLNPRAVSFVQEYIRKQGKELERMKFWGKPYFDLYDNILSSYGLPREMKYLSVIESHLTPRLVSWAGAVGPWQLMDYEAKRFGLKTGPKDERMDFYKSTHAAARLMKELYGEFGDWLLVVAAYNGGAGRVRQAIRKSGSRDFWNLQYHLPEETRNHVKKFIGTHYIFEGTGGVTTMTAAEMEQQKASRPPSNIADTHEQVPVTGRFLSSVVAASLGIELKAFLAVNPGFDQQLAIGKTYWMNLPVGSGKKELFESKKPELLLTSLQTLLAGQETMK